MGTTRYRVDTAKGWQPVSGTISRGDAEFTVRLNSLMDTMDRVDSAIELAEDQMQKLVELEES